MLTLSENRLTQALGGLTFSLGVAHRFLMKTIHFDDGTCLDDPNVYWGDPSYRLEPGDPGYVPVTPPQPKPRKKNHMTHNSYYPPRTADQITWLTNFRNKLPVYASPLTLAAPAVAAAQADCDWLFYVLNTWLPAVRNFAQACTNAATDAQTGDGSALMVLPTFTGPAGGTPVNSGALTRIFWFVQTIRDNSACTDAIATDLGLTGSQLGAPDWNTFATVLKITRAPAGVTVGWGWQGKVAFLDMIELQVDRGTGFQVLAYDTTPGYVDSEPIPATPTKWKYRGIYRVGDQRVGQWSAEATVVVGG